MRIKRGRPLTNEVLGKVCNLISSPQCRDLIDLNLTGYLCLLI